MGRKHGAKRWRNTGPVHEAPPLVSPLRKENVTVNLGPLDEFDEIALILFALLGCFSVPFAARTYENALMIDRAVRFRVPQP